MNSNCFNYSVVSKVFFQLETLYPNLGHLLLTQNNGNKAIIDAVQKCIIEVYSVGSRSEARLSTFIRYGGRPFLISVPDHSSVKVTEHAKQRLIATHQVDYIFKVKKIMLCQFQENDLILQIF